MITNHPATQISALAALLAVASLAHAQPGPGGGGPRGKPPTPPTPPKVQPSHPPMPGGSGGAAKTGANSIVQRDAAGKLQRLAGSPAAAAVGKLPLSAATQTQVNNVQQQDSSSWEKFVEANLVKLMRTAEDLAAQEQQQQEADAEQARRDKQYADAKAAADAAQAVNDKAAADGKAKREAREAKELAAKDASTKKPGDGTAPKSEAISVPGKGQQPSSTASPKTRSITMLEELRELVNASAKSSADGKQGESLLARGGLAGKLAEVLSPDEAMAMQGMVREYVEASIAERIADSKASGQEMSPAQAASAELLEAIGGEFKRAYDRTAGKAAKAFDASSAQLNLTPDQKQKLSAITGESFQQTLEKAGPTDRVRKFSEVYQLLTPAQREMLMKQLI